MMGFGKEEQDLENKGKQKAKEEVDQRLSDNSQNQQGDQQDQQNSSNK